MLKRIRITLAALCFIAITLLFLDFTGTLQPWLGWLATIQFLPAVMALNVVVIVALVLLTLVFGRIYCSVVCPLGVMQDVSGWLGKQVRKNRYTYSKALSWLRYTMLGVMVAAFLAGVGTIVQLLAPYSAYGRIAAFLLQPLWKGANNVLASLAERSDSYAFYHTEVLWASWPVLLVPVVTLAVLLVLAWRGGRTYCNTVCPVGTVLSVVARFSWLKVSFDSDKCRNCSLCTKNCKASCIDYKTHSVDYSRCVVCGDCIESCKFDALKYAGRWQRGKAEEGSVDTGKRSFLLATAMATTAAMAQEKKKVDGGFADLADKVAPSRQTPLTPPGSLSAANMARHCTGCQLCVSECPNRVLRPSASLDSFMMPVMSYEAGYCRPECTRCSDACPAGAIKPLDDIEKSSIQIGHAVWLKKNCIAVTDEVSCGNCARHCPAGAIEMVQLDADNDESPMVPAVNEQACIGCGACEYVCPARPFSAIYVEGHEVHKRI